MFNSPTHIPRITHHALYVDFDLMRGSLATNNATRRPESHQTYKTRARSGVYITYSRVVAFVVVGVPCVCLCLIVRSSRKYRRGRLKTTRGAVCWVFHAWDVCGVIWVLNELWGTMENDTHTTIVGIGFWVIYRVVLSCVCVCVCVQVNECENETKWRWLIYDVLFSEYLSMQHGN